MAFIGHSKYCKMRQTKTKIEPFTKDKGLSEIYQTSRLTFAFVSAPRDGSKQCHQLVKCRDFLQDALRTQLTGNISKIYGFEFDRKKNPPIDLLRTRMLVRSGHSQERSDEVMLAAVKLLNHYEHMAGIAPSKVARHGTDYIFNSVKFWMFSPALISLYTLLIRLGEYDLKFTLHDDDSLMAAFNTLVKSTRTDNEVSYLRTIKDSVSTVVLCSHYIFEKSDKANFDKIYFRDLSISSFHNNTGIVGLCDGSRTDHIQHEYYKRLQTALKEEIPNFAKLPVVFCTSMSSIGNYYAPSTCNFAVATTKDEEQHVNTGFFTCREQLTAMFSRKVKAAGKADKLTLVVTVPGVFDEPKRVQKHKTGFFLAKRVLNFFEATAGMKKSTINTVCLKVVKSKRRHAAWVFNASAEWANSPVMLSLYTLIIRVVSKYYNATEKDPKDLTDEIVFEILSKKVFKSSYENRDSVLLNSYYKQIKTILQHRQKLFGGLTAEDNYFVSKERDKDSIYGNRTYSNIGINSLLSTNHVDKELQSTFKELANAEA